MSATTSAQRILVLAEADMPREWPPEFWDIVERYRDELIRQGQAILGNQADAEEVAQETFFEAFNHREKLADVQSLGAWLRAINKANALNRLRGNRGTREKESRRMAALPPRAMTTGGFSVLEMREAVAKAIETLPQEEREAVRLYYWEHLNYEEIAQRLKVSPRTVWQRLHDAYLRLYGELSTYLDVPGAAEPTKRGPA